MTKAGQAVHHRGDYGGVRDVLSRAELQIRKGLHKQLVQLIQNHAHPIKPSRPLQVTSDPDDNKFLE